jgi:hypothetical protein
LAQLLTESQAGQFWSISAATVILIGGWEWQAMIRMVEGHLNEGLTRRFCFEIDGQVSV